MPLEANTAHPGAVAGRAARRLVNNNSVKHVNGSLREPY